MSRIAAGPQSRLTRLHLLKPECIHEVQPRGLQGGKESEHTANRNGEGEAEKGRAQLDENGDLQGQQSPVDQEGKADPQQALGEGQKDGFPPLQSREKG